MKRYRVYSQLSGKDFIDIDIDDRKIEEALKKVNKEELANKIGTGLEGWNTYLVFNPVLAEFEVVELTTGTHLEYPYLYPILTIQGRYDVPYTLEEALKEGWQYYSSEFKPLKEWIEENEPELLEKDTDDIDFYSLLNRLPKELKEEIWQNELLANISDDISENFPSTEKIINWLNEKFEEISIGGKKKWEL